MAINHDVNGLPWPVVGHLLDHGVDSLMMGINPHFGGHPLQRPLIFDWEGPDGRCIRTFNSEHYCSFHRWLQPQKRSTDIMADGVKRYLKNLDRQVPDYPHDFILMSATHFDFVDNNPPDPSVADMVHQWNEEGREPLIEFVTSDQLAEHMRAIPSGIVRQERGDWPDFWNFGCASSAREVRINRETKARLVTVGRLGGPVVGDVPDFEMAWRKALIFDEHTWGSWATTWNHEADDVPAGIGLKLADAYDARALAAWVLRRKLDEWIGNADGSGVLQGIAVCNPAPMARAVMLTLPTRLVTGQWCHYPSRMHNLDVRAALLTEDEEREVGPFLVPAGGVLGVGMEDLKVLAGFPAGCSVGTDFMESPFYRLTFEPETGRVLSLLDRDTGIELVDGSSEWEFFGYVRESVDGTRHHGKPKYHGRDALFDTDFEKLSKRMESGWQTAWPALRETAGDPASVEVLEHPLGPRLLVGRGSAPGVDDLRLSITLPGDRKVIMLEAAFQKTYTIEPEGIYFTFPLAIDQWQAWYDSAGVSVELDAEQLPGTVRDYQTAASFAAVANRHASVVLACPDAPMVQFGGFHFGKCLREVPRDRNCLLLAWPMNTYWDTNFPASQPGFQRFRYELTSAAHFDSSQALAFGQTAITPVEYHPVLSGSDIPSSLVAS